MNIFLCFTGQGSQKSGMCEDFKNEYPEITNNIINKANEILGLDMGDIMFKKEFSDKLNETINSQPAIGLSAEIILQNLINELKKIHKINFLDKVSYFAGHSVGEYNALCAASVIDFEQKMKLLKSRAFFMQEASLLNKTGMIAILGHEISEIKNIILEINKSNKMSFEIANDNGALQIILSSKIENIDYLLNNYKDYGIKRAIKLNVSGGFHSTYMKGAEESFAHEINNILLDSNMMNDICKNKIIISNVTASNFPLNNLSEIKKLLCMQITSIVKWRETIEIAFKKKVKYFIEIGPSAVLGSIIKKHHELLKIDYPIKTYCISTVLDLKNFIDYTDEIFN